MSGLEIAGLVLGVMGLVPVFKEACSMVKKWRRRKFLKAGSDSAGLANHLDESAVAIKDRYNEFYRLHGDAFARGDGKFSVSGWMP
jgi:hypothetical protein